MILEIVPGYLFKQLLVYEAARVYYNASCFLRCSRILWIQNPEAPTIVIISSLVLNVIVILILIKYLRLKGSQETETLQRNNFEVNQQQLNRMAQMVPGVLYSINLTDGINGSIVYLNKKIIDISGYSYDDFISGRIKWFELILKEDQKYVFESIKSSKENPFFSIEYRIRNKHDHIRWILNQGFNAFHNGKAYARHGIILDVTESKINTLALAEREKELTWLVSSMDDIVLKINDAGYIKRIHAQKWPFSILSVDDLINKHIIGVLASIPQITALFTNAIEEAITTGTKIEFEFYEVIDNKTHWYRSRIKSMPEHGAATILISDITSKKVVQKKLKQSEERLQFILNWGYHILYTCNLQFETTYISPSVKSVLGYAHDDFSSNPKHWKSLIHPEDIPLAEEQITCLLKDRKVTHEYRIKHVDGNWRWMRDQLILIESLADNPVEIIGTCLDITDRKEAEIKSSLLNKELEELKYAINAASIVSITDTKGIIKYANKNFEKISQYKIDELIGHRHNLINSGYHSQKFWKEMWRAISNGEVWKADVKNKTKDGSIYWVNTAVIPIKNIRGNIVEFISIRNEITEKKKNEEQLELLSLVAKHTSNYVIITDAAGRIEWVNESFEKFTGYQLAEIRDKKPGHFLQGKETDKDTIRYMAERVQRKKSFHCEIINYTINGDQYWVEINAQPLKNKAGEVVRYFAIMHNITEQKWMVENLINARKEAEESDRLKSAFIANMSHEIRTPMNAIMGFSELIDRPNLPVEKRKEFAHLIRQRSQDLLGIVNDILDVSKIEAGQMKYFPVVGNIQELFQLLQSNFSSEIKHLQNKSVEIKIYNELKNNENIVLADFLKLHQVLNNLIHNALKFTEHGFIEFGCKLQDQNTLLFTVRDTGLGIESDKVNIIFRPFQQANPGIHQRFGGTGLGLAIIKGILKLWGGKIWVESEMGKGSIFYFTMPYHPQETSTLIEIPVFEKINWNGINILLVEDDQHSALYLKEILAETQCIIHHAENGLKAIEIASEILPLVILLDLGLPDISGKELITHLLQFHSGASIIPITAFASNEHKTIATELGCPTFLIKPITQKRLLKTLMPIISNIKQHENH